MRVDHQANSAWRASQEVQPDVREEVDGLLRKLGDDGTPVVCVDMGSTPRMGLLPSPPRLAAVLDRAMEAAGCGGLVLTGGYGPLEGEHRNVQPPRRVMKRRRVIGQTQCAG